MLLTVRQTGEALGIGWKDVYYLVAISYLGAVKIRGSLRFFPDDVEEFCAERENEARNRGTVSRYYGYRRCHEIIEDLKKDTVSSNGRKSNSGVERRRFSMELRPERHRAVSGSKLHDLGQLWFDFGEVV